VRFAQDNNRPRPHDGYGVKDARTATIEPNEQGTVSPTQMQSTWRALLQDIELMPPRTRIAVASRRRDLKQSHSIQTIRTAIAIIRRSCSDSLLTASQMDGVFESDSMFGRLKIVRVQVHADRIDIMLDQDRVCRCLDETAKQHEPIDNAQPEANRSVSTISIPARLKRTGKEMRIVVGDGSEPATPDSGLVRLLVRANAIRNQLLADRSLTFEDIAKAEGVVPSYATRLFRLTILAPDIVSAILSGRHPPELTARRLMDDTRLPLNWNEQRRHLGFASAH
jgi:hypothetical protein